MAENKIYPWAQSSDANVFSDAEYAADVEAGGIYVSGVKSGQASSKQANKTWRQATAPGAGLGQFLVDNLSVDVTDADTPSTFSTRIANAVLKLAQISPFNQSWASATGGYRKYAIVSDSSGNFWVSTADQNTTVPGADGAKWQSLFDGYATNIALNTETTNRTNADTNLQNQINNRVLKSGDTMTGTLSQNLGTAPAVIATGLSGPATTGQNPWTPQFISKASNDGSLQAVFCARDNVGYYPYMSFQLTEQNGTWHELQFRNDDRLYTASGNVFALESDISNLQNQINATRDALPLPIGMKMQVFTVSVPSSPDMAAGGVGYLVTMPAAFSSIKAVTANDTGGSIYTISCSAASNSQIRVWAQSTQNPYPIGTINIQFVVFGYY